MSTQNALPPIEEYATVGFHDTIVTQIDNCMKDPELENLFKEKIDSSKQPPLDITKVLGDQSHGYWWRLFIDPKDWKDALTDHYYAKTKQQHHKEHPELLYDHQKKSSAGFLENINLAYQHYLTNPAWVAQLDYAEYEKIWETARIKSDDYVSRTGMADMASFGTSVHLANDLLGKEEQIAGRPLVAEGPITDGKGNPRKDEHGNPIKLESLDEETLDYYLDDMRWGEAYSYHLAGRDQMYTGGGGRKGKQRDEFGFDENKDLPDAINDVCKQFNAEIAHAVTRGDQLRAIARSVRRMHILHVFSDGCGRVNISTVLPAMLMHFGFGLPLGGRFRKHVDMRSQYFMFNGGFSVDTIAKWLCVMQDFGIRDLTHKPDHTVLSLTNAAAHDASGSSGSSSLTPAHGATPAPSTQPTHGTTPAQGTNPAQGTTPAHGTTTTTGAPTVHPGTTPVVSQGGGSPTTNQGKPPVDATSAGKTSATHNVKLLAQRPVRLTSINSSGPTILH
jgi:hypothetical protein